MARKSAATPATPATGDLLAMGMASFQAGDFAAACRHLRAARAAEPAGGDALYFLALAPDYEEALFNRALALTDLGESQPAGHLIEQVLRLDLDFAEAGGTLTAAGGINAHRHFAACRFRLATIWPDPR